MRFLRLSPTFIINLNHVKDIVRDKNRYVISYAIPDLRYHGLNGDGPLHRYEIDEVKNPREYKSLTKWISYNDIENSKLL